MGEYVLTSDGELYHWKYIRREKINGKWVYYYRDKYADAAEKKYQRAEDAHTRNINASKMASKRYKADPTAKNKKALDAAYAREAASKKYRDSAGDKLSKAMNVCNKSFGAKVADFLTNASSAIDRAKMWLSKRRN